MCWLHFCLATFVLGLPVYSFDLMYASICHSWHVLAYIRFERQTSVIGHHSIAAKAKDAFKILNTNSSHSPQFGKVNLKRNEPTVHLCAC
jgi:hypothetical protein